MKGVFIFMLAAGLFTASVAAAKIGGGEITFSVKAAGNVVYSHDFHFTKAGLKCSECHYKIFNTTEAKKAVTMADMQKGRSCGACHNGQRAFDVTGNCNRCHTK